MLWLIVYLGRFPVTESYRDLTNTKIKVLYFWNYTIFYFLIPFSPNSQLFDKVACLIGFSATSKTVYLGAKDIAKYFAKI